MTNSRPVDAPHPVATGTKHGCDRDTAKRRKRSAAGRVTGSRSAPYYRRRGGTDPRDPAEGRGRRAMKPLEGTMPGTPSPETISTRRQRIAKLARQAPQAASATCTRSSAEGYVTASVWSRSELMARGAGCLNRARPDLWGAEVGNHPGLPDRRRASVTPGVENTASNM